MPPNRGTIRLILSGATFVMTVAGVTLLAFGISALAHNDSHGVAGLVFGCILLLFAAFDIWVIWLLARHPNRPNRTSTKTVLQRDRAPR